MEFGFARKIKPILMHILVIIHRATPRIQKIRHGFKDIDMRFKDIEQRCENENRL